MTHVFAAIDIWDKQLSIDFCGQETGAEKSSQKQTKVFFWKAIEKIYSTFVIFPIITCRHEK